MINLNLQYPTVLITMSPGGYANYNTPPLDRNHFYGVIQQVNNATMGHSAGDVVLFQLLPTNASFLTTIFSIFSLMNTIFLVLLITF